MYASLTTLKQHLNMGGSGSDAELGRILGVADEVVTNMAADLAGSSATERLLASRGVVVLGRRPSGAVTLATPLGTAITGYITNPEAGLLYEVPYTGTVIATYTSAGGVPAAIMEMAVLMVAGRLWETQRGNTPTILQGDDGQIFTPGLTGILTEVRNLLAAATDPLSAMA